MWQIPIVHMLPRDWRLEFFWKNTGSKKVHDLGGEGKKRSRVEPKYGPGNSMSKIIFENREFRMDGAEGGI